MALTYGFFNSIDGDRTYNADQMSQYFKGLVSSGVYESVGGALQVIAGNGMTVNVQTGRAIVYQKWMESDAVETITISAAHAILNRYTAVVVRLKIPERMMEIATVDGTPASTPLQPAITNSATVKEICLAMIYVPAGATSISQANITDMRPSDKCGWITGLIKQVDTSTLFLQWQSAYQAYYDAMTAQFEEWFSALTQQLNVNTFIRKFDKRAVLDGVAVMVYLDMQGYTYSESDIINVYINGLYAVRDEDYFLLIDGSTAIIAGLPRVAGTVIDIQILRSQIGFYVVAAGPDDGLQADSADTGVTA